MIRGFVADAYFSNQKYVYRFSVQKNDRTNLRKDIEKCWVNCNFSVHGVDAYVDIDWATRQINISSMFFCRKDIYVINICFDQVNDHYNIFVNPDLTYYVVSYRVTDPLLFQQTEELLKDYINYYLTKTDSEYIHRQQKWFLEKPYQQISGKTPEQAVTVLESFGW